MWKINVSSWDHELRDWWHQITCNIPDGQIFLLMSWAIDEWPRPGEIRPEDIYNLFIDDNETFWAIVAVIDHLMTYVSLVYFEAEEVPATDYDRYVKLISPSGEQRNLIL